MAELGSHASILSVDSLARIRLEPIVISIAPAGSTHQRMKNATALIERSHSDSFWR